MKFKFGYVLIYVLFLGMGLVALIGGAVMLAKNLDLKFNGIKTKGIIIDAGDDYSVVSKSYLNGRQTRNDSFYPVIKYPVNNDSITSTTHSSANNVDVAIGDEVNIVYRPTEPEYVELSVLLRENIIVGCVCFGMGLLFTGIVALIGYRIVKLKREEQQKAMEDQMKF